MWGAQGHLNLLLKSIMKLKIVPTLPLTLFQVFKLFWIMAFVGNAVAGYGVKGEESLFYGIVLILLTFPICLSLIFLVDVIPPNFDMGPPASSDLLLYIFMFAIGYFQWFVLIPFFYKFLTPKSKRKGD